MNTLDWRNKEQWLNSINDYANELLNQELLETLRSRNISECWSDDMSWLPDQDLISTFESSFCNYYTHIKCFHGCRPVNVGSYYERGFVGQNAKVIEEQFKQIFKDIDTEFLEKSIMDLSDRGRSENGSIYFVCNDNELIEQCGHYLIQGSEYIMAMAASLCTHSDNYEDYRLRLRDAGIPTIFEVDVPIHQIPSIQIAVLIKTMIASWGNTHLLSEKIYDYQMGFVVHSDIKPSCIVSHCHPKRIIDPHFHNIWYYPKTTKCEMCK